jgi:glucose/arabinose dehydrogenase
MPMTDRARFPDAMQPLWTNNSLSQGLGPATFLSGPQWLAWEGRLMLGIMGARRLVLLEFSNDAQVVGSQDLAIPAARYRALTQGPDGSLYIATDGGEIWRMTPSAPTG